jgi:hypothetical protein
MAETRVLKDTKYRGPIPLDQQCTLGNILSLYGHLLFGQDLSLISFARCSSANNEPCGDKLLWIPVTSPRLSTYVLCFAASCLL